jgi:hypothetical protein
MEVYVYIQPSCWLQSEGLKEIYKVRDPGLTKVDVNINPSCNGPSKYIAYSKVQCETLQSQLPLKHRTYHCIYICLGGPLPLGTKSIIFHLLHSSIHESTKYKWLIHHKLIRRVRATCMHRTEFFHYQSAIWMALSVPTTRKLSPP